MWSAVTVLIILFFVFGGLHTVNQLVEGRRKLLLDVKKQEARVAEAKAKELELQYKRAELEYREALLELERFDRRTGAGSAHPPPPRAVPPELDPERPPDERDGPA